MASSPSAQPVDLDALDAYLRSDRAPSECMDLSELDGFLAGLAAGPAVIPWEEALPVVWRGETPEFTNPDESAAVHGAIHGRHAEIASALEHDPADYAPVFWEDLSGTVVSEDWAVGFMQAVALRQESWRTLLQDEDSAVLLIPIAAIAGMAEPAIRLDDMSLPESFLEELLAEAETVLPGCVRGLYAFWHRDDAESGRPN